MATELDSLLVDDRTGSAVEALPLEKRAVVVAREEAGLLALGALGDGQPGRGRLVACPPLSVPAERERHAVEQRRIDGGEHVGLILGGVAAAGDQPEPVPLDDPRVVAGPEHVGAGPLGEGDQGVEAESSVAAHARIRRQPVRVPLDERLDDARAEHVAQIERDVREPEPVAGFAGGDDGIGRAARALGTRAGRIEPEAQRDTDRVRSRAQERDSAVDAAAHRDGDSAGAAARGEHRRNRVGERVGGERLAGHRGGLEQGQADERPLEARSVGGDDSVVVDEQLNGRVVGAAGGVSDQLEPRHSLRLAGAEPRQLRRRGRPSSFGREKLEAVAPGIAHVEAALARNLAVVRPPDLDAGRDQRPGKLLECFDGGDEKRRVRLGRRLETVLRRRRAAPPPPPGTNSLRGRRAAAACRPRRGRAARRRTHARRPHSRVEPRPERDEARRCPSQRRCDRRTRRSALPRRRRR